jgi:hypothetical protein
MLLQFELIKLANQKQIKLLWLLGSSGTSGPSLRGREGVTKKIDIKLVEYCNLLNYRLKILI